MPKIKTSKTAAKRFKVTGKGKLLYCSTRLNHLMMKKRSSRRRRLMMGGQVVGGEARKVRRLIPGVSAGVR